MTEAKMHLTIQRNAIIVYVKLPVLEMVEQQIMV